MQAQHLGNRSRRFFRAETNSREHHNERRAWAALEGELGARLDLDLAALELAGADLRALRVEHDRAVGLAAARGRGTHVGDGLRVVLPARDQCQLTVPIEKATTTFSWIRPAAWKGTKKDRKSVV